MICSKISLQQVRGVAGAPSATKIQFPTTFPALPKGNPVTRHLSALLIVIPLTFAHNAKSDEAIYLDQIKPLFKVRCYACHGALKQESDLRLDTASRMQAAGILKSGKLLERVSSQDLDHRMPPEGEPLEPEQIASIRQWIKTGAHAPPAELPDTAPADHWSFQRIERPAVPGGGPGNPIDAFLAAKYRQHQLVPQGEALRIVLLRRLYIDLIGVPPTAAEIAAAEKDPSPQWYEKVGTRLLDDPRYGERWGRHWMDVWRYSDWWGLGAQLRNSQKHIWHWRDWIVESLNDDMPYDEMVQLMLAGDELHPGDLNKLRGTGYLARNWRLFNRNQWMEETVEHVGKAFLGLTFNCAKCHDHKFDPIAQQDFYRMRAFFEPYHVRTDVVSGEADVLRDGIPRAFDGELETPTYLFVRGNEKHPDKSVIMKPGVPDVLNFKPLHINPVQLPPVAWQPERQPWVLKTYLAAATGKVATAQAAVKKAQEQHATASQKLAELARKSKPKPTPATTPGELLVHDTFDKLAKNRWKLFGGDWVHKPGHVEQNRDGAQRASLRLLVTPPRDFEAMLRFTTRGGSTYRSVGIAYDISQVDPTQSATPADSEQHVYASAASGGSKVQASFSKGGKSTYPPNGMRALPVELGKEYRLRIRVRGTLVNAFLDDQLVVAWQTPLARRDGTLQLTTFDALAVFHEFSLKSLDPAVKMAEAASTPTQEPLTVPAAKTAVTKATGAIKLAEMGLQIAQAEKVTVQQRGAALRAVWQEEAEDHQRQTKETAIRAQQQLALLKHRRTLADAEMRLVSAAPNQKAAIQKELAIASKSVTTLQEQLAAPVDPKATVASFVGAKWSATRFRESRTDDPTIAYPPQSTGRRTALATWITDRDNPLAARVAVNQIWMRHMGRPLVSTVFDFGRKGSRPAHPQLLDWLAVELMENGWSMKHVHRLIVTSAAYRLSSSLAGAEANVAKDPENLYWWRREPIRLQSQVMRDSILSLAGTLDLKMGGPPILAAAQASSQRRSLYFFHSNNARNLFLTTFDEARVTDCYRREESIVPQQALALTNSTLVQDAAGKIAARLSEGVANEEQFIRRAFAVLLGIHPGPAEVTASMKAIQAWQGLPEGSAKDARTQLVWTLINHNDFVTLR